MNGLFSFSECKCEVRRYETAGSDESSSTTRDFRPRTPNTLISLCVVGTWNSASPLTALTSFRAGSASSQAGATIPGTAAHEVSGSLRKVGDSRGESHKFRLLPLVPFAKVSTVRGGRTRSK